MIEHLVLFKVKSATSADDTERMLQGLRSLKGRLPVIQELTCGTNTSDRSQGFTHGLFARFKTRAELDSYINHPEHQQVVTELVRPIVEGIIVVDYET